MRQHKLKGLRKSWADYKKDGNGYRYFSAPFLYSLDPLNIEAKMQPGGNANYFILSALQH